MQREGANGAGQHVAIVSAKSEYWFLGGNPVTSKGWKNAKDTQGRVPHWRPWDPVPSGDQIHAKGNAAGRRPAAHPICRRRGARGGHRTINLRDQPRQKPDRGSLDRKSVEWGKSVSGRVVLGGSRIKKK